MRLFWNFPVETEKNDEILQSLVSEFQTWSPYEGKYILHVKRE
jgi:hypothetical protein